MFARFALATAAGTVGVGDGDEPVGALALHLLTLPKPGQVNLRFDLLLDAIGDGDRGGNDAARGQEECETREHERTSMGDGTAGNISPRQASAGAIRGRTVSRVLFPVAGSRSSLWGGRRRPPRAAYPRLGRCGPHLAAYLALLRLGVAVPWPLPAAAVGSYPTVSPLPPGRPDGGLFSVALSVASRRPGVTWQSALWSSDFPRAVSRPRPAVRPQDNTTLTSDYCPDCHEGPEAISIFVLLNRANCH